MESLPRASSRSRTRGCVRSSAWSSLLLSSDRTNAPPGPGAILRIPATARSSSVAERSSSVTTPMRHRAPASAGGTPSGTSRRYFARNAGRCSRPVRKKSTNQSVRAAAASAPPTAQAIRSMRSAAAAAARALARRALASRASASSSARRLCSTRAASLGASARTRCGNSRCASTKVCGGRSSTAKTTAPSGPRRTTPFRGPCPHARTSPAGVPAGRTTSARTRSDRDVPAAADELPGELAGVGVAGRRRRRRASGRRTWPSGRSGARRPRCAPTGRPACSSRW